MKKYILEKLMQKFEEALEIVIRQEYDQDVNEEDYAKYVKMRKGILALLNDSPKTKEGVEKALEDLKNIMGKPLY